LCDFAQKVLFSSSRVEVNEIPEIKSFGAGDRVYVQAQQVWLVLVAYIMSSGRNLEKPCTIPYGKLAQKLGKDPRAGRNLTTALGIVGEYCKYNDLPTINSIVVNEKTGVPGDHVVLRDGKSPAEEQSDVMKRNWFTFRVPTTGTFRKVWEAVKDEWSQ
jgi:hypothetical protein